MAENKHTAGPWVADEAEGEWAIGDDAGRVVAYLHQDDIDLLSEREANARLIAAAPDLLAALKGMVSAFGDITITVDGVTQPETDPEIIAARAAIARATQPGEV